MNWQKYKSSGEPIYEMRSVAGCIEMRRISRVIHHSRQFGPGFRRSVRYNNRWQQLHEVDELKTRYRNPDGSFTIVYLNGIPFEKADERLPFIRAWEEPGSHYQVFGY